MINIYSLLTTVLFTQEHDNEWAVRIQCHKFRWYNSQWLDMVEEAENIDTMGGEEMAGGEGLGHSYLHHSDVLDHQGIYSGLSLISVLFVLTCLLCKPYSLI